MGSRGFYLLSERCVQTYRLAWTNTYANSRNRRVHCYLKCTGYRNPSKRPSARPRVPPDYGFARVHSRRSEIDAG